MLQAEHWADVIDSLIEDHCAQSESLTHSLCGRRWRSKTNSKEDWVSPISMIQHVTATGEVLIVHPCLLLRASGSE